MRNSPSQISGSLLERAAGPKSAALAKRHNVSISAVAVRWVLDLPVVRAVIVSSKLCRLREIYRKQLACICVQA